MTWAVELELEVVRSGREPERSTSKAGQSTNDQKKKQKSELDHQVAERLVLMLMSSETLCWQAPSCSESCPFSMCSFVALLHGHHCLEVQ